MAERHKLVVTRTVTLSDLTPAELASIFAGWDDNLQAEFFTHIAEESKDWPGTGWEMQACHIADKLASAGKKVVLQLAQFITPQNIWELPE